MDHSSFFSSAQASRFPSRSKYMPLLRPAGCRKVESFPSRLHSRIRSLGWSVKNTLPAASAVGPSAKDSSPASLWTVAPGARRSSVAATGAATATARGTASSVECQAMMPLRMAPAGDACKRSFQPPVAWRRRPPRGGDILRVMRLETIAIHAGGDVDPATGSVSPPIHLSTTFEHGPASEVLHGYLYTREGNPVQSRLEQALAALEGGPAALAFASGMAAGSAYLQSLPDQEPHPLPPRRLLLLPDHCCRIPRPLGMRGRVRGHVRPGRAAAGDPPQHTAGLDGDAVQSADERRRHRRRRRDRPRRRREARRGRHLRDADPAAAPGAWRRRRPALEHQVLRRPQRRAGRRFGVRPARRERRADRAHPAPARRRGIAVRLLARPARAAHAGLPGGAALGERTGDRGGAIEVIGRSTPSSTRDSPRTPATRWRGGR